MKERTNAWSDGYDVGYQDGEHSADADWYFYISEHTSIPYEDITPEHIVQLLKDAGHGVSKG